MTHTFETGEGLRREARARAKRYPEAAAQLDRLADGVDRQIEEMKCGPLFTDVDLTANRLRDDKGRAGGSAPTDTAQVHRL